MTTSPQVKPHKTKKICKENKKSMKILQPLENNTTVGTENPYKWIE